MSCLNFPILTPIQRGCSALAVQVMNPPMTYDVTNGTPTAQGIFPPFTNLPCHIDEINGVGAAYVWNFTKGVWN